MANSMSVPAFKQVQGHDYVLQQGSPYSNHYLLNNAIDKIESLNHARAAQGKPLIKYMTTETSYGPALYVDNSCDKCGKKLQ